MKCKGAVNCRDVGMLCGNCAYVQVMHCSPWATVEPDSEVGNTVALSHSLLGSNLC